MSFINPASPARLQGDAPVRWAAEDEPLQYSSSSTQYHLPVLGRASGVLPNFSDGTGGGGTHTSASAIDGAWDDVSAVVSRARRSFNYDAYASGATSSSSAAASSSSYDSGEGVRHHPALFRYLFVLSSLLGLWVLYLLLPRGTKQRWCGTYTRRYRRSGRRKSQSRGVGDGASSTGGRWKSGLSDSSTSGAGEDASRWKSGLTVSDASGAHCDATSTGVGYSGRGRPRAAGGFQVDVEEEEEDEDSTQFGMASVETAGVESLSSAEYHAWRGAGGTASAMRQRGVGGRQQQSGGGGASTPLDDAGGGGRGLLLDPSAVLLSPTEGYARGQEPPQRQPSFGSFGGLFSGKRRGSDDKNDQEETDAIRRGGVMPWTTPSQERSSERERERHGRSVFASGREGVSRDEGNGGGDVHDLFLAREAHGDETVVFTSDNSNGPTPPPFRSPSPRYGLLPSPCHPDPHSSHAAPAAVIVEATLHRLENLGVRLVAHGTRCRPKNAWIRLVRRRGDGGGDGLSGGEEEVCLTWQTETRSDDTGAAPQSVEHHRRSVVRGPLHALPVASLLSVDVGRRTDALRLVSPDLYPDAHCLSLLTADGSLDLSAETAVERDAIVSALCLLLDEAHGGRWRELYEVGGRSEATFSGAGGSGGTGTDTAGTSFGTSTSGGGTSVYGSSIQGPNPNSPVPPACHLALSRTVETTGTASAAGHLPSVPSEPRPRVAEQKLPSSPRLQFGARQGQELSRSRKPTAVSGDPNGVR